jgi:hypothetical protein
MIEYTVEVDCEQSHLFLSEGSHRETFGNLGEAIQYALKHMNITDKVFWGDEEVGTVTYCSPTITRSRWARDGAGGRTCLSIYKIWG